MSVSTSKPDDGRNGNNSSQTGPAVPVPAGVPFSLRQLPAGITVQRTVDPGVTTSAGPRSTSSDSVRLDDDEEEEEDQICEDEEEEGEDEDEVEEDMEDEDKDEVPYRDALAVVEPTEDNTEEAEVPILDTESASTLPLASSTTGILEADTGLSSPSSLSRGPDLMNMISSPASSGEPVTDSEAPVVPDDNEEAAAGQQDFTEAVGQPQPLEGTVEEDVIMMELGKIHS